MSNRPDIDPAAARQATDDQPEWAALSRLMDGEATASEAAALCAAWRQEEPLRGRWHDWQLIGDVMRSDELTGAPQRDQAMLQALRVRLAQEPVPLAPAAWPSAEQTPATPGVRNLVRRWRAPVAAAAGFVAVASVLVMMQGGLPQLSLPGGVQAQAPAAAGAVAQGSAAATAQVVAQRPSTPSALGGTQRVALQATPSAALRPTGDAALTPQWMLRDVGLDRYVSAHRKMPLGAEMPGRAEPMVQLVRVEK